MVIYFITESLETDDPDLFTMSLTQSTVNTANSRYSQKPCLSDVGHSNSTVPTEGQVVYRNKIYPSATMALEAYIDEYFGLSKSKYYQHGRDCVAELLLMAPLAGESVSVSALDAHSRGIDGGGGSVVTDSFEKPNEKTREELQHSGRFRGHLIVRKLITNR